MKYILLLTLLVNSAFAGQSTQRLTLADRIDGSDTARNFVGNGHIEKSIKGYATYADAAGSTPVNGTGGAPTVTFTRSLVSPLEGIGSGLLTKDAANRQGEGVSYDFSIDPKDVNRAIKIAFDYDAGTSVVGASSDVQVYVYDVTNSVLIVPNVTYIPGATGRYLSQFAATGSTSYRLILHIATTNAAAWTFKVDNVVVSSERAIQGAIQTNWEAFTPTFTGFGTVSTSAFWWRRMGSSLQVRGSFTSGTPSATLATVSLPNSLVIASTIRSGGSLYDLVGVAELNQSIAYKLEMIAKAGESVAVFDRTDGSSPGLNGNTGNDLIASGQIVSLFYEVPIAGWDSNITLGSSSTFLISSYLANGTRVNATPTQLGQYRALYRNTASSNVFTDVSSVATAITTANGALITSTAYASTGTNSIPERYEIFVGKNKNVFLNTYSTTGKTGSLDSTYFIGTATESGLFYSYDPTTGVVIVDASICINAAATTSRFTGRTIATAGPGTQSNGYFDLIVAENALAVGLDFNPDPVLIKEVQTSGTVGGTFTSGAWRTRTLNTVENSKSWVTLAANQFTLQPGKYEIEAVAPAYHVDNNKIKLRNITDSTDDIIGQNSYATSAGSAANSNAPLSGVITVYSAKTFEIQHYCTTTLATNGFGQADSFGVNEVYTMVKIRKIN